MSVLVPSGAVETLDEFVLKRVAEDERYALAHYNRDMSLPRLEWTLETCLLRRQLVTAYRTLHDSQEVHEAYELCLSVIAELYSDHPDYAQRWRLRLTVEPADHDTLAGLFRPLSAEFDPKRGVVGATS